MGRKDTITKDYMADNSVFADVFNHMIYQGEPVIDPKKLHERDTTALAVPYGTEGTEVPYQKYRDVFKVLSAMEDENAVYLILGVENQSELHYAMPVKNMAYDSLGYADQVQKAAASHRKALKQTKEKAPSAPEFLSGFYKEDRLLPIITVVIYFGTDAWSAPRSLHEMFIAQDEKILSLVPDYRINLIAPAEMTEEELNKFTTNFGDVMKFIKYSRDDEKLKRLMEDNKVFQSLDVKAARVIKEVTGMKVEIEPEDEKVNVCKAILDIEKKGVQFGMERYQELMEKLLADNRIEDMKRAVQDSEFRTKLFEEYGIKYMVETL